MFLRIAIAFALVLGVGFTLALVYGQKQVREHRIVKGVVTKAPKLVQSTITTIASIEGKVDTSRQVVKAPHAMWKAGKLQPLSEEQKRMFVILATFFRNDFIMVKVAACESSLWQHLPDGRLQRGPDGSDLGLFMIREPVHEAELRRYGLDPADFAHNVAFATYLRERDGLSPWNSTRHCWETLKFVA